MLNIQTESVMHALQADPEVWAEIKQDYENFTWNMACDGDRIDALSDSAEVIAFDMFLSGTETPLGDYVIRDYLNAVRWYEIGRDIYVELGSGS